MNQVILTLGAWF